MTNYLLIHGSFGSPFVNWFPYLRKELESQGKIVYTPDFPTGVGYQTYENWELCLADGSDSEHDYIEKICNEIIKTEKRIKYTQYTIYGY